MCGIAGILNFNNNASQKSVLKNMTDVISHRGPDDEGHWLDGPVGLGHRRLSIIDLSKKAHQPMLNEDESVVLTFNGEIYNYKSLQGLLLDKGIKLFSNSDTEVILRLYELFGTKALNYLEGMFAFGIWDKKKDRLFIARDRVGIKPLYYSINKESFAFASEIKALLAGGFSKKRINSNALMQYMRLLVVPQPDSIFEDIYKLNPGNFMIIQTNGDITRHCYWDIKHHISKHIDIYTDTNSHVKTLQDLLEESIRSHMIADVPVGAFLSGGLDSSLVVANMRHFSKDQPISTFSTIFPGKPEYDESKYIYQVSKLFQTNHTSHVIDQDISKEFKKIAWHCDEPFGITSSFALYFLAKEASKKLKVVLSGDGADELFAGYTGYSNEAYLNKKGLPFSFFNAVFPPILFLYKKLGLDNQLIRKVVRGFAKRSGTEGVRYSEQTSQNSIEAITNIFSKDYLGILFDNWGRNKISEYYDSIATNDRLTKKLYTSYKTRLIDEMMMKVDRMTMAHSLEARPPILDHKIVEFAFNIPSELKIAFKDNKQTIRKYVLKKAAENKLPNNIIYRKKHPYNVPLTQLSNSRFKNDMKEKVFTGFLSTNKIISKKATEALYSESAVKQRYQNMLILLYSFETWISVNQNEFGSIQVA